MEGLYAELQVAARELSRGFYGWREGTINGLFYHDGENSFIAPHLNPARSRFNTSSLACTIRAISQTFSTGQMVIWLFMSNYLAIPGCALPRWATCCRLAYLNQT